MFYHVQTHEDIPVQDAVHFRQTVLQTLQDPRGWGTPFYEVPLETLLQMPKSSVFIIRLTPAHVMNEMYEHFKEKQLSVANMSERTIDINWCRWTENCPNLSQLPLDQYRQYVILHEVGHMMGKKHPTTVVPQTEAPVMMQQTLGIQHHQPNPWPTDYDKKVL